MQTKHDNEWTIRISDGDGFWEYVFPDGSAHVSVYDVAEIVRKYIESRTESKGKWIGYNETPPSNSKDENHHYQCYGGGTWGTLQIESSNSK